MRRLRSIFGLAAVAVCMLAGTSQAMAAKFVVDDDAAECKKAQFTTIQAAVNAAGPGDDVEVCRGLYTEVVVVGTGKDGLDVYSKNPLDAVIKAPPTIAADVANDKSIVRVTESRDVGIRRFTITGPGPGPIDSIRNGVRVDSGGSADILDNHITLIRDTPFTGVGNRGLSVRVGATTDSVGSEARITGNLMDEYQKGAVTINRVGSYALIEKNTIVGAGPTAVVAQNGIAVGRGAAADILNNDVSGNAFTGTSATAAGILIFLTPGTVQVEKNSLDGNQIGIDVSTAVNGQVTVEKNKVIGGPSVQALPFGDGILFRSDTASNVIEKNRARDNVLHDCHDDSTGTETGGVANVWTKNNGETENKPGLCVKGNDD